MINKVKTDDSFFYKEVNCNQLSFCLDRYEFYIIPRRNNYILYYTPFEDPIVSQGIHKYSKDYETSISVEYDPPRSSAKITFKTFTQAYNFFRFIVLYVGHRLYQFDYAPETLFR